MATCINSSRSCLPPFYTIPIFPLFKSKDFSFTCIYMHAGLHVYVHVYIPDDLGEQESVSSMVVGGVIMTP